MLPKVYERIPLLGKGGVGVVRSKSAEIYLLLKSSNSANEPESPTPQNGQNTKLGPSSREHRLHCRLGPEVLVDSTRNTSSSVVCPCFSFTNAASCMLRKPEPRSIWRISSGRASASIASRTCSSISSNS